MREIKFRVYCKIEEKVYSDAYLESHMDLCFINELLHHERERYVFMQYTGFKDKNGKEIYEGDILYHKIQGKRKVYYPIFKENAAYGLLEINTGMVSFLENTFLYEVIGNIYENKELLEDK